MKLAWMLVLMAVVADPLATAEQAFAQKRYEDVLPALKAARQSELTPTQKRRAFELEAMTDAAFGDSPHAIDAFEGALDVDPDYHPAAEVSPKVRGLYDEAHRRFLLTHPMVAAPAASTLQLTSPQPTSRPVWKRWWFWTAAGVVVAGAASAVVVAHQPKFPAGSLGQGTLK